MTALRRKQIKTTVATVVGAILLLSDLILKVPEAIQKLAAQGPAWVSEPRVWTGVVIVGITGLVIWLIWKKPDPEDPEEQSPPPSVPLPDVKFLVYRALAIFPLRDSDPRLVFTFWVYNGSQIPIRAERIEGMVKCQAERYSGDLKVVGGREAIPPGTNAKFTIEQRIPSDQQVKKLIKLIEIPGGCIFSFDTAKFFFSAGGREYQWPLPEIMRGSDQNYDRIRWPD